MQTRTNFIIINVKFANKCDGIPYDREIGILSLCRLASAALLLDESWD